MNQVVAFDYHFSHSTMEYDAYQGIAYVRKRLKKRDRPIRTFKAVCTRQIVVGAIFLTLPSIVSYLEGVLMGLFYLGYLDFYLVSDVLDAVIPLIAGAGAGLLALGILNSIRRKKSLNKLAKIPGGFGQWIFDEIGICDIGTDGTTIKYPWTKYDCCVITQQVVVLFFDSTVFLYAEYSPELDWNVTQTLSACGKAETIYRRRIC